jgi:D-sedoheptulose 7-phosphate isomerase
MDSRIIQSAGLHRELVKRFCDTQQVEIEHLAGRVANLFADGGQLLTVGTGIFHPVAQLVATAFAYRLDFDRPALPAICLGSDSALAAAMASTGDYEQLFIRHYRALNGEKQLLLLFGNGIPNPALERLRDEMLENDQAVALFSGAGRKDPLYCNELDWCLDLATANQARQIELMQFAGHLLCELVEGELFQC